MSLASSALFGVAVPVCSLPQNHLSCTWDLILSPIIHYIVILLTLVFISCQSIHALIYTTNECQWLTPFTTFYKLG